MNLVQKLIGLDRATQKNILIIGDSMRDVYVHGRFGTCQEECYKFIEEIRVVVPGGASNAARQLENWDAVKYEFGDDEENMSVKTRYLVNGKFVFRHDADKTIRGPLVSLYQQETREFLECRQSKIDAILISDYDKGFLTPDFIREVIGIANQRSVPIVADVKRCRDIYFGTIIKANSDYASRNDMSDIERSVITKGGEGCFVFGKRPDLYTVIPPGNPVSCINHVGAGDCFAAHLVLALAHGMSLVDSASIAHSAGRVYVQHPHNRAPFPHEIARDFDPVGGKALTAEQLPALRKSAPGKLVFTNGVFRVPHAGHAWLLRWAKSQGDVLVVGVNTDESAAQAKPGEYVMSLAERIEVLASMDAVDWIVPFADATPRNVVSALSPDIMVKGAEYAGTNVPGSESVKDVRFAVGSPVEGGSSDIVARIVKKSHGDMHHDQDH
jgi:D-beta-D-heptose 7-phosphate kinase/D-beta-D-heptose 1-phosphate adenosyltransferase